MRNVGILLLVAGLLAGCTSHTLLRDPKTGQVVNCTMQANQASRNPITRVFEERKCAQGYKASGFECTQGCGWW